MSVDLNSLGKLVAELEEKKQTVDEAIAETEARMKVLRVIKASLGVTAEPKPRGTRKKETVAS
jgi:hypothetical protein